MILAPVRLLRKLTYLGKVGNLRRMRIRGQKRGFGPKWSFATPSNDLQGRRARCARSRRGRQARPFESRRGPAG